MDLMSNIAVKASPFGRWTSRKRAALYLHRYGLISDYRRPCFGEAHE